MAPLHSTTSTTSNKSSNKHLLMLLVGAIGGIMLHSSFERVNQLPGGKLALSGNTERMMVHLQEASEEHVDHMLGSIRSIASRQALLRQQYDQQQVQKRQEQERQKHEQLHRQAQQQVLDGRLDTREASAAHSRARSQHVHASSRPVQHQLPPKVVADEGAGVLVVPKQPPVVKGHGQQQKSRHRNHDTVHVPQGPSTANCAWTSKELLSVRESGGFFCDSDESWLLKKEIARLQQPHQKRTTPFGMNAFYQENWEPNFSCEYERRLGQPGDGGKWVCDPHKLQQQPDCLVYSFGSNNAFDFEEAIHRSIGVHCEIHTFDHTIGNNPSRKPSHVNFHPWGIGTARSGVLRSLDQIAKDLHHIGRTIHIFKIDVEGAEFRALPQLLDSGVFDKLGIQQVLIEVHRDSPGTVHALMEAFHRAGYAIFHKEANIQFPMSPADVCVEFAFVKLGSAFFGKGLHHGGTKTMAAPVSCSGAPESLSAMKESGGFFCDDDEAWKVKRQIARLQQPVQKRTSPRGMRAFYQENWEPNFSCGYERRLGQPGDGGKWVCDPHKLKQQRDCLVYSFGSNNAFDFEEAIHRSIGAHCETHTFDHTIGNNPSRKPKYVNFHPWGIGTAQSGVLRSLDQIAKDLNHVGRTIHIFKIDVEGAEFSTLPKLLNDGVFDKLGIQQVLIEVHRSPPSTVHALMEAFHRAGYFIFHKEPNIQFPMSNADVCVEFAFIKLGWPAHMHV